MNDQIVTVEVASKLHCIGYEEPSLFIYTEHCVLVSNIAYGKNHYFLNRDIGINQMFAPLWQECIDWFREQHFLIIEIQHLTQNRFGFSINKKFDYKEGTFYEIRKLAILEAIEIIKNKQLLEYEHN